MAITEKSYKNMNFLNSPEARTIRMLCEYEEPRKRLQQEGIENTIVFFGSARSVSSAEAQVALQEAQQAAPASPNDVAVKAAWERAQKGVKLSRYYDDTRELARRLS